MSSSSVLFPADKFLDRKFWLDRLQNKVQVRESAAGILSFGVRVLVSDVIDCVLHIKKQQAASLAQERKWDLASMTPRQWEVLGETETKTGNPLYLVTRADLSLAIQVDQDLRSLFSRRFTPRIHAQILDPEDDDEAVETQPKSDVNMTVLTKALPEAVRN